ncbi:MAG: lasso peptide biosynthesis B2 protein [Acidobacteria bacterium]|nr:MAG: lasso peptide biosynthesis B2 protein [Acidobacteriota bacterium]
MKLTREDVVLIARMMPWRVVLPVAKRVIPLSTLVSVMALPRRFLERRPLREKRVASLAHRVSGLGARSPANCLERSLLAYRFLSEMGAGPRLVLGVRKQGATVEGHAWVEVDGRAMGEPAPQDLGYAPTTSFAASAPR